MKKLVSSLCAAGMFALGLVAPAGAMPAPRTAPAVDSAIVNAQFVNGRYLPANPDLAQRYYGNRRGWDGGNRRWDRGDRRWDRGDRWDRRDRGGYYRGYRGSRDYRAGYRRYNDGFWYPGAAFITGAIVGGAIASQPRTMVRRDYGSSHVQWCYDRYRSYRASDNSFQPYNGPRRECRSPYY